MERACSVGDEEGMHLSVMVVLDDESRRSVEESFGADEPPVEAEEGVERGIQFLLEGVPGVDESDVFVYIESSDPFTLIMSSVEGEAIAMSRVRFMIGAVGKCFDRSHKADRVVEGEERLKGGLRAAVVRDVDVVDTEDAIILNPFDESTNELFRF